MLNAAFMILHEDELVLRLGMLAGGGWEGDAGSSILDPMLKPAGLDRAAVRRAFNARATAAERADFLLAEVERRLAERLAPMRLPDVGRVLDLGCGLGRSLPLLAQRFPQAALVALDLAEKPLLAQRRLAVQARRGLQGFLARWRATEQVPAPLWVAADAHRLPLPANSVDVVWSNLVFHWLDDPLLALAECHRVLRPDGLLLFSAFGVDTCRELRAETTQALLDKAGLPAGTTWPSLQDMHDWGDAMMARGFVDPVMDVEHIRLSYRTPAALAADMAALGFPLPVGHFVPSLGVELVFGHAWIPAQKTRLDGLAPINIVRKGQLP